MKTALWPGLLLSAVNKAPQNCSHYQPKNGLRSDAYMSTLFEPFGRASNAILSNIPGLGLYFSRGLAEAHGGFIGLECQQQQKAAVLHTHMLVSLGSALFMVGAILFAQDAGSLRADASVLRLDPIHVFAGIVTGIGFLGAGQIFRSDGTIRGMTTAAAIWVTAGMGVLVGIGSTCSPWLPSPLSSSSSRASDMQKSVGSPHVQMRKTRSRISCTDHPQV